MYLMWWKNHNNTKQAIFLVILNSKVLIKLVQSWLKNMCSATKKVILYTIVFRKERQGTYFPKQGTRISQITYTLSIKMSSHCVHISNYMREGCGNSLITFTRVNLIKVNYWLCAGINSRLHAHIYKNITSY